MREPDVVPPPKLRTLQCWMQDLLLQDRSVKTLVLDGLDSLVLRPGLAPAWIKPSSELSSVDRLEIYRRMVALRFQNALAEDYPAIRCALGSEVFSEFAREYASTHPSESFTLDRYGHRVSEFLEDWRVLEPSRREWISDLASLEHAMNQVAEFEDQPGFDPDCLRSLDLDHSSDFRFTRNPSLVLVGFRTCVETAYEDFLCDRPIEAPVPLPSHVAIFRSRSRIRRLRMSRTGRDLLQGLALGRTLGEAASDVFEGAALPLARIEHWIARWVAEGIFSSCET